MACLVPLSRAWRDTVITVGVTQWSACSNSSQLPLRRKAQLKLHYEKRRGKSDSSHIYSRTEHSSVLWLLCVDFALVAYQSFMA